MRTVVVKRTYRQTRGSDLIVYMQVVEHILRFIPPLFALLKAGLLIGGFNEARRLTVDTFSGFWRNNRLCFRRSWLNKVAATETLRDTAPPNADQQLRRRRRPDSQEAVEKLSTGKFELKSVGAREMNSVVPRGLAHVPTPVCVNQTRPGSRRVQNQYVEEFSV
ncbi:unnamed protein product [Dibothriocephalus latus]|uniref:Uncharacterized protein n=1 Tax=Dibothriocephalus latus TaxID=60516 RepID=A0A3P7MNK4_DIBLA|nr:unnamed protein product [Dibothriocephalus latus]